MRCCDSIVRFTVIFANMSSLLSAEQLEQLPPDTKQILLQYFDDQNTRVDDMRAKYERLRVDSGKYVSSFQYVT